MSERTKRSLEIMMLIIAMVTAVVGFSRTYFVAEVKIEQVERTQTEHASRIEALQSARTVDHGLLERIDERTKRTDERTTRIENALDRMAK